MTVLEEGNMTKVKVAVRVRPFNKRELELKSKSIVTMNQEQTVLSHPLEEKEPKPFTFDHCFNSSTSAESSSYSSQEEVFKEVGSGVVESSFSGYNACIFAYGQTGSGKSYTMMGSSDNMGIIPRLCNAIFQKIGVETNESTSFKVEVSYMEIYNERVRDLLDPKNSSKRPLKVREHAILGPMVEGLSVLAVSSYEQIARLMEDGNKCRTVAATNMNAESSRSHAVFTIRLSQTMADLADSNFTGEKVSKISLVDLAGSERAQKSGAVGKRLEEGANINKSLTTLGMVISALAERNAKKEKFVPYRDSVLTWLLKDNLGGNSKTVMIATVSPSGDNYEETLSTLRYADRAKKIVNHAVVNEDPNAKVIRELREEVENLRLQINQNQERQNEAEELRDRLAESERLVEMMNKSWEDRLKETDLLYREHQRDLAQIGICVAESGIKMEKDRFYLVNLNADPSLNELLVYYINQKAIVGSNESNSPCSSPNQSDQPEKVDFLLQGLGVHPYHAILEIVQEPITSADEFATGESRPKLYVSSLSHGARICVNGRQVDFGQKTLLRNGFRLLIGNNHFFRVNCPKDETYRPESGCTGFLVPTSMSTSSIGALDGELNSGFIDYDKAWLEANSDEHALNDSNGGGASTSSVSTAMDQYMEQIAIKYQEDKQAALEKQYEEFERYIQGLAQSLQTPSTPMTPAGGGLFGGLAGTPSCQLPPVSFPLNPRHSDKSKFFKWAQKREDLFKQSLSRLKTEIIKANALAREANLIAEELWVGHSKNRRGLARYDVTLQIPASNLRPSKIKAGNSVCEPVIVVKWQGMSGYQLWTVDHLENKLVDMRELYNERQLKDSCAIASTSSSSGICCIDEDLDEDDLQETEGKQCSLVLDSLFESQEKHSLIGVANVFLEVLFHQLRLDYQVPIISQQGEVCGKLHVEIYRLPDSASAESDSSQSTSSSNESFESEGSSFFCDGSSNGRSNPCFLGSTIKCRVRIKKAMNLPANLSHFVFCQYSFFNLTEMLVVAPNMEAMDLKRSSKPNAKPTTNSNTFKFDHQQDFTVLVTEEFLEYVQEDALSIEVWGHRSGGEDFDSLENVSNLPQKEINKNTSNGFMPVLKRPQFDCNGRLVDKQESLSLPWDIAAQKRKSLRERWAEVTKRIELWVEIKEMNDAGEYVNVDVMAQSAGTERATKNGCSTGGVFQLKQGQQRRLSVRVRGVDFEHSGGTLPLCFSDILSVGIGSIVVKEGNSIITSNSCANPDYYGGSNWNLSGEENLWSNKTEATRLLDSYQEEDLDRIREQWSRALASRHQYLETQINELALKGSTKSELEIEREQSLINQWVELTEERNAVSLPSSNSSVPGAPADWRPPTGIEYHVPVVFLDLNAEELAADEAMEDEECATFGSKTAGLNTMLPYEKFEQMIQLPVLEKDSLEMSATCSWDSSIHFCHALNRPSGADEMVFAIVNATCRLSYPFSMDLVIRKRICLNIYKKPSFADRLMRRIVGTGNITGTGVFYDIVAHIPKSSLDMEDRATLALMAVRHTTCLEEKKPCTSLSSELATHTECMDSKADICANQTTMGNNCWSYVEAYTKSIQAVEWMLKLDRLRQESAMLNMLSRQEQRAPRVSHYGQSMSNLRMKRTISLPNTTGNMALPPIPPRIPVSANTPVKNTRRSNFASTDLENGNHPVNEQRLMEVSASSSSGYSSMVNSMVSPLFDHRLTGIVEEQITEGLTKDVVIRSSTVPETLHDTNFHAKLTPSQLYTPSNSESQDSLNNNDFSLPSELVSNDLNSSDESNLSCTNHLFDQNSASFNQFEETEGNTSSIMYPSQTHSKSFFGNTISATAMLNGNNNLFLCNKQKESRLISKTCQRSPKASSPPVSLLEEILEN